MNKEYQDVIEIINRFIVSQRYVMKVLNNRLNVPIGINAEYWAINKRKIATQYNSNPFAKVFRLHGIGIKYSDDAHTIDYDYSKTGRLGGFDGWRLYVYTLDNNIFSLYDHAGFNFALDNMNGKEIEWDGQLYYLM